MKKVTIIYWSGTGNTTMMANAISEGVKGVGNPVDVVQVEDANKDMVVNSELLAFGCPSMGAEVLEEEFMEPFIESLKDVDLSGKKVALFGSYDWGNGEWMQDWEARMKEYGASVIREGLILHLTPDDDGIEKCKELGEDIARA
ncbi:MAG: flavodoxin [Clostridia bacterium]|nr:flavodoxin [Clostridia bacterium]